ncbi:unnamed protein product [Fructobacillus evanidus]|uniref:Uncharacterized protein n=2 Tax=Fructobacillus TaxID=559173 RepID=A0ABN9YK85_9LACO|nr:unnamed protein product [Fructobacillus sp. LMG 32999]CAK1228658.1 unnamed protein product [Fructobacillus tropaeoli]CAK1231016.1 unnamed protein product [Fructobacillus sp. LMG 32999]CAK1234755.1 unnamed protein product [Fructobacillus tropaeoli]CAK1243121.1 unnamed protein product [Fructobacillus sp. LMG 32999]
MQNELIMVTLNEILKNQNYIIEAIEEIKKKLDDD